jgi:hypothetical protein
MGGATRLFTRGLLPPKNLTISEFICHKTIPSGVLVGKNDAREAALTPVDVSVHRNDLATVRLYLAN